METAALRNRRFSYFNKLIADEDIPLEELQCLAISSGNKADRMDVCSPIRASSHFDTKSSNSEFESEAYLEYRRRVYKQLAEEHENEKLQNAVPDAIDENESEPSPLDLHSSSNNGAGLSETGDSPRVTSDLQPAWDDSDLISETYNLPSDHHDSYTLPWQTKRSSTEGSINDSLSKSVNALDTKTTHTPLNTWSSFDDQIQKAELMESNESITSKNERNQLQSQRSWKMGRNSFQKQKMEREMIRKKLSMTNPDEEDLPFGSDKPWYQPRFERAYSSSSQSLQICYINESCSSDESENPSCADKQSSDSASSFSAQSPTSSPNFESARGYGMGYLRQHRLSDASNMSSLSSPTLSSSSSPNNTENTIIHHHGLRSGRTKQDELELEARYELAQAHRKAKVTAEQERLKSKLENASSIVHQLLSNTLDDETNCKVMSYSLVRKDCEHMTLGQLQLILNDMHMKKQVLNDNLLTLLVERDELQNAQECKLVDIDDMKSILSSVGPETTV